MRVPLVLLVAAAARTAVAQEDDVDHLIDRIAQARIRSPITDAAPLASRIEPLAALRCEGELPQGAGRIFVLPLAVDRQGTLSLDPPGPTPRRVAGRRFVGCDRQAAFNGLARRLDAGARRVAVVDRPCRLELTVDRCGRGATLALVGDGCPRQSASDPAPIVARFAGNEGAADSAVDLRPVARDGGFVALVVLPDALGLQRVELEFRSAGPAAAWEIAGYELVESRGCDRIVVPAEVNPAHTSVSYTPAPPAPVTELPFDEASPHESSRDVLLMPGTVALRGVDAGAASLEVAGAIVVPDDDSTAAELRFTIRAPCVATVRLLADGAPTSGAPPLLLQPQARWLRPFTLQRGAEVAEPRHPLVDHAMAGSETRRVLVLPPTSELRFAAAGGGRVLELELAAVRTCRAPIEPGPPRLLVSWAGAEGEEHPLAEWSAPLPPTDARPLLPTAWLRHAVELPDEVNARELVLRVVPSAESPVASGLAALLVAEPRLVRVRRSAKRVRPNLLVYLVDTLRADRLHGLGNERETSPDFDAFARASILFTEGRSQAPWTRPSIATFFTGLAPEYHGVTNSTGLAPALTTLAERLRACGFATAAFTANAEIFAAGLDFEQGFDRFESFGREDRLPRAADVQEPVFEWLDENRDRPFFLFVHTIDPHDPYDPPPETAGRFTRPYSGRIATGRTSIAELEKLQPLGADDRTRLLDLYDEEVAYADAQFGALLQRLRELGLYDDTVILFLADHGEELLDHGGLGHVRRLWDEVLHVPMALKLATAGGAPPPRCVVDDVVRTLDWLPTFAAIFGLAAPAEGFQGVDLSPSWNGQRLPTLDALSADEPRQRALLHDGWKLLDRAVAGEEGARASLFHVAEDPRETRDLAADRPEIVAALRARLQSLLQSWDDRGFARVRARRDAVDDPEALRALQQLGYVGAK